MVSGLVSPAGDHCAVPPADRGASPGSPRAANRETGSIQSVEKPIKKISFNPDSPSSAHPFYVLDNFIDVGLIDLNLLPGNKQSDGLSLSYISFDFLW